MKATKSLFLISILFLITSCSLSRKQKKGVVQPEIFNYETTFTTQKTVIILPVTIDGVSKNFLFDTGADVNVIQRDSMFGKISKVSGASNRKMKMGEEYVSSLKIGEVEFKNTFAMNADLVGLKEQIPNFGGLIGQPVINKANWLIDYPNKKLQISNQNIADETFKTLEFKREDGAPHTFIILDGIRHKVVIDFGSSSELSLPKESKLAKELLLQYEFTDHERQRYTLGGLENIKEKIGILPLVKLGGIAFKNVTVKIGVQSQPRIGIAFFKDCIIYIDNLENSYKIKK